MWIKLFVLFFQICSLKAQQLTSISLTPDTTIIKDTRLGNQDMSRVVLDPLTAVVSCFVKTAVSTASGATVDHPFNMRYQTSGSSFDWYVIFDSTSPFKLDSTVVPIYNLTIECLENTDTKTADMTIQVLPNQQPAVIDYPGTTRSFIATSVPVNMLLYKVTATDGDGDALTYTYNIQPPVNYFTIDPVSQEIKAAVDFRSVTVSLVTVTVDVTDGFDTVTGFTLLIQITSLNIRPQITNLPTPVTVQEDANSGTLLIDLAYEDPDFTQTFTPNCSVFPKINPSILSISGSRLTLAPGPSGTSLLDYETTPTFQITCTISDGYLLSEGDILTLNVQNVNEKPVFNQQLYSCSLDESKAGESTCNLFLTVQDPENNPFTISIRPGINNARFTFASPASDILSFAVDYDIDNNFMPSSVLVDIEARDSNGAAGLAPGADWPAWPPGQNQIRVTISDVNDNAPIVPAPSGAIQIDDLTNIGIVGVLLATDDDSGQNGELEYKLTTISPLTASSYLNVQANGQIHYTQRFTESLAGSTVLLTVDIEDKGVPTKKTSITQVVEFVRLPTTTIPPPTTVPIQPSTVVQPVAPQKSYFDEPANIAMVAIIGLIVFIAILIALFFCMKKILLGYCCKPSNRSGRVHPSYDDYDYDTGYYTPPPRPSRHHPDYPPVYPAYPPGHPAYYRDYTDQYIDPRYYRDGRYNRDRIISAGSIRGEFIDDRSRRSKHSRLALQQY